MSGACGNCTLCCTVMKVTMADRVKPERTPCDHCTSAGCAIYDNRPEPCQVFKCVWLGSQDWQDVRLPSTLRPDRTGIVIEVNSAGFLIAHCARPSAWRREPMRDWLVRMAGRTRVLIEAGETVLLLQPSGATERLVRVGVDLDTNETLYVRAEAA